MENCIKNEKVHKKVLLLIEFYNEYGMEPKRRSKYKGVNIGEFFNNIKSGRTKITQSDRKMLEDLGLNLARKNTSEEVHKKVLLLTQFYEEYEREPKQRENYKDIEIGQFFKSIKYGNTEITKSDRKMLESLGINLDVINKSEEIHKKVLLLIEFYNEYGSEPKRNQSYKGIKIGQFFGRIKSNNTQITKGDRKMLEDLGLNFAKINKADEVHKKVLLLTEFYKEYGRKPKIMEEYHNIKIGHFFKNIKFGNTEITKSDREMLENLGLKFTIINKADEVHKKVLLLIEFYNEYGRAPKTKEEYHSIKLGSFFSGVKYGNIKITQSDRKMLENLGLDLSTISRAEKIHKKVLLLIKFYNEYGRAPKTPEEYHGEKIGEFFNRIKSGNTKITQSDRKMLEDLGFNLSTINKAEEIHRKVLLLIQFYEEYGRQPKQRENYKDIRIGQFLNSIKFGNTQITRSDRKMLENLGFNLVSKNKAEETHKKVLLLTQFYKEYEREPKQKENYKDVRIGQFFSSIKFCNTKITKSDKEMLKSLGLRLA